MKTGRAKILLRCLRQAALPDGGLTDGHLLARYVARRDDDAFEALVRRHGPMVLGVCRRVLRHAQDAEDAFQATFLVLAKRAAAVASRAAVGGWLYTVAYHAALAARASGPAAQGERATGGRHAAPRSRRRKTIERELLELLDRELARLPEKYRLPVVLCELEGRSRREAARQLGLAEGTLSSRLAAARKIAGGPAVRHGPAVAAASLTGLLAGGARAACVPGRLGGFHDPGGRRGRSPPASPPLTQGVMKAMLLTQTESRGLGAADRRRGRRRGGRLDLPGVRPAARPAAAGRPCRAADAPTRQRRGQGRSGGAAAGGRGAAAGAEGDQGAGQGAGGPDVRPRRGRSRGCPRARAFGGVGRIARHGPERPRLRASAAWCPTGAGAGAGPPGGDSLLLLWALFLLTYSQGRQAVECFPTVEARFLNPP